MKIWRSESENEEVLMKWLGSPFVSKAFQRNCIRSTHFRKLRCGSNSRGHRTDMCPLSSAPLPKRIRDGGKRPRSWAIELRGFPDSVSHDPKIICCIPSALKSLTDHKLLFLLLGERTIFNLTPI